MVGNVLHNGVGDPFIQGWYFLGLPKSQIRGEGEVHPFCKYVEVDQAIKIGSFVTFWTINRCKILYAFVVKTEDCGGL